MYYATQSNAGCDSKLLSCHVYTISRRGIVQQGSTFGPTFLLLPIRVARAHAHSSPQLLVTAMVCGELYGSMCKILHQKNLLSRKTPA